MEKKYEDKYRKLYKALGRDPEDLYTAILSTG
jgi:hypothetical protein